MNESYNKLIRYQQLTLVATTKKIGTPTSIFIPKTYAERQQHNGYIFTLTWNTCHNHLVENIQ